MIDLNHFNARTCDTILKFDGVTFIFATRRILTIDGHIDGLTIGCRCRVVSEASFDKRNVHSSYVSLYKNGWYSRNWVDTCGRLCSQAYPTQCKRFKLSWYGGKLLSCIFNQSIRPTTWEIQGRTMANNSRDKKRHLP